MEFTGNCRNLISTHDFILVENKAYFVSLDFNGLYCLHLPEKILEFMGAIPEEHIRQRHLYGAITELHGKLYMPPMNGNAIAIYDIEKKSFEKIELKYACEEMKSKFYGVVTEGNKVFFIPGRYRYVVVLDVRTGQIEYLDAWSRMQNIAPSCNEILIKNGTFILENNLYVASSFDNYLIKISTLNYQTELIKIPNSKNGFIDMSYDAEHDSIWFLEKGQIALIRWNLQTGEVKRICPDICFFVNEDYPVMNMIVTQKKIYLLAYQHKNSLIFDKASNEFVPVDWEENSIKVFRKEWGAKHYFAKKLTDESFVVNNVEDYAFWIIKDGVIEEKIWLEDILLNNRIKLQTQRVFRENGSFTLKEFIRCLHPRSILSTEECISLSYGKEIYDRVTEE